MRLMHRSTLPLRYEQGTPKSRISISDDGSFVVSTNGGLIYTQKTSGETLQIDLQPKTVSTDIARGGYIVTKLAMDCWNATISRDGRTLARYFQRKYIQLYNIEKQILNSLAGQSITKIGPMKTIEVSRDNFGFRNFSAGLRYCFFDAGDDDSCVIYDLREDKKFVSTVRLHAVFMDDESTEVVAIERQKLAVVEFDTMRKLFQFGSTNRRRCCKVEDTRKDKILLSCADYGLGVVSLATFCTRTGVFLETQINPATVRSYINARFIAAGEYAIVSLCTEKRNRVSNSVCLVNINRQCLVDEWVHTKDLYQHVGPISIASSGSGKFVAAMLWCGSCHVLEIVD